MSIEINTLTGTFALDVPIENIFRDFLRNKKSVPNEKIYNIDTQNETIFVNDVVVRNTNILPASVSIQTYEYGNIDVNEAASRMNNGEILNILGYDFSNNVNQFNPIDTLQESNSDTDIIELEIDTPDGFKKFVKLDPSSEVYSKDHNGNHRFIDADHLYTKNELPGGIFFKPDGTKMFVFGNDFHSIFQYTINTPWDMQTISYNSITFDVSNQDKSPKDIFFTPDGTKFYIVGLYTNTIYQYSMSKAWDISSASYNGHYKLTTNEDIGPTGVYFKPDGTLMYVVGSYNSRIYQYYLNTPWEISTASYNKTSPSINNQDRNMQGLFFKPDGSKMFVFGNDFNGVFQYTLNTPWDIQTISYTSITFDFSEDDNPSGIFFRNDGVLMHMVNYNDEIYEYKLSTPWDLSTIFYNSFYDYSGGNESPPIHDKVVFIERRNKTYLTNTNLLDNEKTYIVKTSHNNNFFVNKILVDNSNYSYDDQNDNYNYINGLSEDDYLITHEYGNIDIERIATLIKNGENINILSFNYEKNVVEYNNIETLELINEKSEILKIETQSNDNIVSRIKLSPTYKIHTENNGVVSANQLSGSEEIIMADKTLAHIMVETSQTDGIISYNIINSLSGNYSTYGSESIYINDYMVTNPSVHNYIFYMVNGYSYTSYVKSDNGEEVTGVFTLVNNGLSMDLDIYYLGIKEDWYLFRENDFYWRYIDYTPIVEQEPISRTNPHLYREPNPPAIILAESQRVENVPDSVNYKQYTEITPEAEKLEEYSYHSDDFDSDSDEYAIYIYHLNAVHVAYPEMIQEQIERFRIRFEDKRMEYYKNGKIQEYNQTKS